MATNYNEKMLDQSTEWTYQYGFFMIKSMLLINAGGVALVLAFAGQVVTSGKSQISTTLLSDISLPLETFTNGIINALLAIVVTYFAANLTHGFLSELVQEKKVSKSNGWMALAALLLLAFSLYLIFQSFFCITDGIDQSLLALESVSKAALTN
jgi:uncharacterized membrane protein